MVTSCFAVSVADWPAFDSAATVRQRLSELIGGCEVWTGSVSGTRNSTAVPVPLRVRCTERTGCGVSKVQHQADAALDVAQFRVAKVLNRTPARSRVAIVGETHFVGILGLVLALWIEIPRPDDGQLLRLSRRALGGA